ncbi:class I SAM-dependent methyltransferase [Cohnella thailandensis]|uniref:Class I SAM-dependent methyltransferase n=1 Tax=Cohnella thailandensis TaxID=557557 RepID=A0A841T737_9BACL|nr:class I SAM-dependent methyltransferase [Cohnella thailandensis]MBB6637667.1 class I SAM-dependent methyltransferase [Cohnella thailandensis]MBP1974156.1 SAM-dependent methyltransferase [Cohnella thailandensis]
MTAEKNMLKQAYNNFAEQRERTELEPWKREERESFLNRVKSERRESLLEIGAGTGRDSLYFSRQGLDVTAVDLSEEMVRLCTEKGLRARLMDFSELDFPEGTFDTVYALNCLLHVPKAKLDGVLQEIKRVLKPGGLFFCGLYGGEDSEGIWDKDAYEPKRFFAMYEDDRVVAAYTRQFELLDFHTVDMGQGRPHFQSLLLRK